MPAVTESGEAQRALKVAARTVGAAVRQKLPLTQGKLQAVVTAVTAADSSRHKQLRDAAVLMLLWAGMFRCSELVGIQWAHVRMYDGVGVAVYVPYSKTDAAGENAQVLVAQRVAGVDLVQQLRGLQQLTGSSGYVFKPQATSQQHLDKGTVATCLKAALAAIGEQHPEMYAAHSFRLGGATHAATAGVELRYIMTTER